MGCISSTAAAADAPGDAAGGLERARAPSREARRSSSEGSAAVGQGEASRMATPRDRPNTSDDLGARRGAEQRTNPQGDRRGASQRVHSHSSGVRTSAQTRAALLDSEEDVPAAATARSRGPTSDDAAGLSRKRASVAIGSGTEAGAPRAEVDVNPHVRMDPTRTGPASTRGLPRTASGAVPHGAAGPASASRPHRSHASSSSRHRRGDSPGHSHSEHTSSNGASATPTTRSSARSMMQNTARDSSISQTRSSARSQRSQHAQDASARASATPSASTRHLEPVAPQQRLRWRKGGEAIGRGAFGVVYLGLNENTGELLAVKEIPFSPSHQREMKQLEHEINVMRSLQHRNIVRYMGAEVQDRKLYIFTEWMPGGSLAHVCERFGALAEKIVRLYTRQILVGLAYLHENMVIHRDIKGANILVDMDGVIKLADFGASRRLQRLHDVSDADDGEVLHGSLRGTPYFMAPEIVTHQQYSAASDVWAVGCTVLQLATGRAPWKAQRHSSLASLLQTIVATPEGPPVSSSLSPVLRDFLRHCFAREPTRRPHANDLLLHPFIVGDAASTGPMTLHATVSPLASPASEMQPVSTVRAGGSAGKSATPSAPQLQRREESAPYALPSGPLAAAASAAASMMNRPGLTAPKLLSARSTHAMPRTGDSSAASSPRRAAASAPGSLQLSRQTWSMQDSATVSRDDTPAALVLSDSNASPSLGTSALPSSISVAPAGGAPPLPPQLASAVVVSDGATWSFVPGGWYMIPTDARSAATQAIVGPVTAPPISAADASEQRFMAAHLSAKAPVDARLQHGTRSMEEAPPHMRLAQASISASVESGAVTTVTPMSARMTGSPSGQSPPPRPTDATVNDAVVSPSARFFTHSTSLPADYPSASAESTSKSSSHKSSRRKRRERTSDVTFVVDSHDDSILQRRLHRGTTGVFVAQSQQAASKRSLFGGFMPTLDPIAANDSQNGSEAANDASGATASSSAMFTQVEVTRGSVSERQRSTATTISPASGATRHDPEAGRSPRGPDGKTGPRRMDRIDEGSALASGAFDSSARSQAQEAATSHQTLDRRPPSDLGVRPLVMALPAFQGDAVPSRGLPHVWNDRVVPTADRDVLHHGSAAPYPEHSNAHTGFSSGYNSFFSSPGVSGTASPRSADFRMHSGAPSADSSAVPSGVATPAPAAPEVCVPPLRTHATGFTPRADSSSQQRPAMLLTSREPRTVVVTATASSAGSASPRSPASMRDAAAVRSPLARMPPGIDVELSDRHKRRAALSDGEGGTAQQGPAIVSEYGSAATRTHGHTVSNLGTAASSSPVPIASPPVAMAV